MTTINFTNGKNPAASVRRFASVVDDALRNRSGTQGRQADATLVSELVNALPAIESGYPDALKTAVGRFDPQTSVLIHNSPHYGNTDLARLGDIVSTVGFISKNPEINVFEVRTVVDTNTAGRDSIYVPEVIVGANARIDLNNAIVRANGLDTPLSSLKNPVGTDVVCALEKDAESITLRPAKELMRTAIAAMPGQDTFAGALRIFNRAVHLSLLRAASEALEQQVSEYMIDIPLSTQLSLPMAKALFDTGVAAAKENRPANASPRLCGYVLASLAMNPTVVKGGRAMHTYYHEVTQMLSRAALLGAVPPLIVVPEMRLPKSSIGCSSVTIPTLNQAIETTMITLQRTNVRRQCITGTTNNQVVS